MKEYTMITRKKFGFYNYVMFMFLHMIESPLMASALGSSSLKKMPRSLEVSLTEEEAVLATSPEMKEIFNALDLNISGPKISDGRRPFSRIHLDGLNSDGLPILEVVEFENIPEIENKNFLFEHKYAKKYGSIIKQRITDAYLSRNIGSLPRTQQIFINRIVISTFLSTIYESTNENMRYLWSSFQNAQNYINSDISDVTALHYLVESEFAKPDMGFFSEAEWCNEVAFQFQYSSEYWDSLSEVLKRLISYARVIRKKFGRFVEYIQPIEHQIYIHIYKEVLREIAERPNWIEKVINATINGTNKISSEPGFPGWEDDYIKKDFEVYENYIFNTSLEIKEFETGISEIYDLAFKDFETESSPYFNLYRSILRSKARKETALYLVNLFSMLEAS